MPLATRRGGTTSVGATSAWTSTSNGRVPSIAQSTTEPEAAEALATNGAGALLNALAEALGALAEWSGEGFKSALQSTGKAQGRKGRDLFMPVRAALTGRTHGPELPLLADLLGKTRCIERLQDAARRAG